MNYNKLDSPLDLESPIKPAYNQFLLDLYNQVLDGEKIKPYSDTKQIIRDEVDCLKKTHSWIDLGGCQALFESIIYHFLAYSVAKKDTRFIQDMNELVRFIQSRTVYDFLTMIKSYKVLVNDPDIHNDEVDILKSEVFLLKEETAGWINPKDFEKNKIGIDICVLVYRYDKFISFLRECDVQSCLKVNLNNLYNIIDATTSPFNCFEITTDTGIRGDMKKIKPSQQDIFKIIKHSPRGKVGNTSVVQNEIDPETLEVLNDNWTVVLECSYNKKYNVVFSYSRQEGEGKNDLIHDIIKVVLKPTYTYLNEEKEE